MFSFLFPQVQDNLLQNSVFKCFDSAKKYMKAIGMKPMKEVYLNSLLEQLWRLDTLILLYA